jgi:SAM-dependent methyltransferase
MTDPTTSRTVLTSQAYACGQHLSARQALYDYQAPTYDIPGIVGSQLSGVNGVVIDIGCGNGRYVRRLRADRPDLHVVGLDIAAGILREVPPPAVVADAAALPFRDGSANGLLAMHMLYHVTDVKIALAEVVRLLDTDGVLVASTNALDDKRELDDLWSAAAADVLGITTGPRRISLSSRFPLDHAAERIADYFHDVQIIELPGTITVDHAEPVIAHLGSYRAWAHQAGVPFEPTLQQARHRLNATIQRDGRFDITCLGGVIVCRHPRQPEDCRPDDCSPRAARSSTRTRGTGG